MVVPLFSYVLPLLAAATSALSSPLLERVPARVRLPILLIASSPVFPFSPILPSFILPVPVVEPRTSLYTTTLLRLCQHRYCTLALPLTIPSQLSQFTLTIKETSFAGETRALLALRHLACVAVHREIAYSSSRRTVEASVRGVRVFWPCFRTPCLTRPSRLVSAPCPSIATMARGKSHCVCKAFAGIAHRRQAIPIETLGPRFGMTLTVVYTSGMYKSNVLYCVQPCGGIHACNM